MKVLVTGGAGFIGSHVVRKLVEENVQVSVVDIKAKNETGLTDIEVAYYQVDICDAKLEEVFKEVQPDQVIHLAAQPSVSVSVKQPIFDLQINVQGTLHILELMKKYGTKKIIFSSSAALYGNPQVLPIDEQHPTIPLSPYGLAKLVSEQYIQLYGRQYGLDYTLLRYSNVYGPGQTADGESGVITIFMDRLKQGLPLYLYGDGGQTRDFIYVVDVANANYLALKHGSQATLNISTGEQISLLQLISILEEVVEREIEIIYEESKEGDIYHSLLDPQKANKELNWQAIMKLSEGLKRTYSTL